MVDASLRMTIVNLFTTLKAERKVSFIFITHDLSTAHYVADAIAIMNQGAVVEAGDPRAIPDAPQHACTRHLLDSIPRIGKRWAELEVGDEAVASTPHAIRA